MCPQCQRWAAEGLEKVVSSHAKVRVWLMERAYQRALQHDHLKEWMERTARRCCCGRDLGG
eukprot:5123603-Prorocentrum_lima.AAC.1